MIWLKQVDKLLLSQLMAKWISGILEGRQHRQGSTSIGRVGTLAEMGQ